MCLVKKTPIGQGSQHSQVEWFHVEDWNRPNLAVNCQCLLYLESKWKMSRYSRCLQLSSIYFLQNVFTIFHSTYIEVYVSLTFHQIFCFYYQIWTLWTVMHSCWKSYKVIVVLQMFFKLNFYIFYWFLQFIISDYFWFFSIHVVI